jgi:hypothetical protein
MAEASNPESTTNSLNLFDEALEAGPFTDRERAAFLGRFSTPTHPDRITPEDEREFLVGVLRMGLTGRPEGRSNSGIIFNVTSILEKGKDAPFEP